MNMPKMPSITRLQRRLAWCFFPSLLVASALAFFTLGKGVHAEPKNGTQTLVFLRHAEKPAMGLGQLNCQGLNRAIELSEVLPREFGKADFIFAANPSRHVEEGEGDQSYSYVRPLMTVGPSAIKLGLPVNLDFGANDTADLADELMQDKYHNAVIYTAWSHGYLPELINKVAEEASGKSINLLDDWTNDDFDSVVVVTLKWVDGKATLDYKNQKQGLDNGTQTCPEAT
ncbi:hypothetical protein [Pseudomonas syringae]|uniref:hypothetical protein n=1 Tax=Pseudomonas syringae TaxID=317 RepID=UPI000419C139|nr:hypothetical protein [Pseudomonas syringae]KZL39137.1 hypothetical protein VT47_12135 [Pseudomonas syringae pv. syringae]MBI6782834.1 hypothetical protein [Pseudomonas syringae]MBI6815588.1 hypothetical protein [Pseudomonas syringae]MBI6822429.1 hypothetical protein [Pseudomonas syringae]MCH5518318.1 hypothetical protein [Pseudomonas syringae pv. lapsa]